MNDIEYDILDELYFVTPFRDIATAVNIEEDELCRHLQELVNKGYVKAFYPDPDTEVELEANQFRQNCPKYFFLATKAGLMLHNSR